MLGELDWVAHKEDHVRILVIVNRIRPGAVEFVLLYGIHVLSHVEAAHVAHYKFGYDGQGKLVFVTRQVRDQLVTNNSSFDTFVWFVLTVDVERTGDAEVHTYYNVAGEKAFACGGVW